MAKSESDIFTPRTGQVIQGVLLVAVLFIQNPPVNEKVPGDCSSSGGVGMREEGKAATLRYL